MTGLGILLIYTGVVVILTALWDRWRENRKDIAHAAHLDRIDSIMANINENGGAT